VTGVVGTALAVGSLLLGKTLFLDKAVSSGFGDGVIPLIGYGDILAVSPWLFLLGVGIASVTGYVTLRLYVRL
jgi:cell division transport system permease protein